MIHLTNDNLSRALHNSLYQRMLSFCIAYTPEFPGEQIVQQWLSRLYSNDTNLHILITLDDKYQITQHSVIDIVEAYGDRVVFCHQTEIDRGSKTALDSVMEYLDKLMYESNAVCISAVVSKNVKVYEKKYGYTQSRVCIIKSRDDTVGNNEV